MEGDFKITCDFGKYTIYIVTINKKFDKIYKRITQANEVLEDSDAWEGDSHDTCAAAHQVIAKYTEDIRALIDELAVCLCQIEDEKAVFETDSTNVLAWG